MRCFGDAAEGRRAERGSSAERGVIVFQRGVVKRKAGEFAGSLEDLDGALELEPREAKYYNERAVTLIQLGQMERSLTDCTRAIELDPRMLLAYLNRRTLSLQAGNSAAAAQDFERALEIAPADWPGRSRAEDILQQARAAAGRTPSSISE